MSNSNDAWEHILDPDKIRDKLISSSLYMTAFELLKASILERVRSFYTTGFDSSGFTLDEGYSKEVLSRNKSELYASLDWLAENGAIDRGDIDTFNKLKATRNQLAHEIQSLVLGGKDFDHASQFHELADLYRKIELWWILNIEIPTNPDFDGVEVSSDDVTPGSLLVLQIIVDVASGNRELLDKYRELSKK